MSELGPLPAESCETCKFSALDHKNGYSERFKCRRYPPASKMDGYGGLELTWVIVRSHDWCGEYGARTTQETP